MTEQDKQKQLEALANLAAKKYSCRRCGDSSVSAVSCRNTVLYGCKKHPITDKEQREIFSEFVQAVRNHA